MSAMIVEHDVTVHCGDAAEQLAGMPGGSVQCCVTSPPYYGLRDYGVAGQLGLEASPASYVEAMRGVFGQVRRVLADDGVLWLNLGDSYVSAPKGALDTGKSTLNGGNQNHTTPVGLTRVIGWDRGPKNLLGMPWRVAFALQDDGWILRNAVIWSKPNAMPESVTDRLSCRYEHVFLFSKSRRYWFDLDAIREPHTRLGASVGSSAQGAIQAVGPMNRGGKSQFERSTEDRDSNAFHPLGRNPGDLWAIATSPYPGAHFATMPYELARRCILAGCPEGGTVLDPFAGSGTTLMAARRLGRKSVGIELNADYIDLIRGRIGQTPFDFDG